MSTIRQTVNLDMAKHNTLSGILENSRPAKITSINESLDLTSIVHGVRGLILESKDSNSMIDQEAAKIKFKEIDGDQDNSFNEGSDDDSISDKLDDNGQYVGKGKTTIYDKKIDLEDESKSTQRWVETSTGKVSDGETEQVPNPQGVDNLNENDQISENEAMDFSDNNPHAPKTLGFEDEDPNPKHKGPNIDDHKNPKSIYNKNTTGAIKNLFANVQPKKTLQENSVGRIAAAGALPLAAAGLGYVAGSELMPELGYGDYVKPFAQDGHRLFDPAEVEYYNNLNKSSMGTLVGASAAFPAGVASIGLLQKNKK